MLKQVCSQVGAKSISEVKDRTRALLEEKAKQLGFQVVNNTITQTKGSK